MDTYVPALNGGLYTGEPFAPSAPWRNFPVIPCTAYLNHVNLRSAQPPMQALFQVGATKRPGNNDSDIPCGTQNTAKFDGDKNFGPFASLRCMPCIKPTECATAPMPPNGCQVKWVQID